MRLKLTVTASAGDERPRKILTSSRRKMLACAAPSQDQAMCRLRCEATRIFNINRQRGAGELIIQLASAPSHAQASLSESFLFLLNRKQPLIERHAEETCQFLFDASDRSRANNFALRSTPQR